MQILVTGAAGYIGSHTVKMLCENGYNVIAVDNLSTGHKAALQSDVKFYNADIGDKVVMSRIFADNSITSVIHFAAFSLVGESVKDPLKYYKNNVCNTRTLIECMVEAKVKNIVFSSTAAVYGEAVEIPLTEKSPTQPTNPYGETKLAMEWMLRSAAQAYDFSYVALRYFNACGADESALIGEAHDPETHLIPLVLQVPLGKRESISVFGTDYPTKDGTCIRDYIHVNDLARAHIDALSYIQNGGKSDVFNLGNGTGFSVNEIIESARRVCNHPIPQLNADRREGDPAVLIASGEKARAVLGFTPQITNIEEIINSAWHWHSTHPRGYK